VSTISDMNTQIASAAEEQSSVAEEMNRNIVAIRDVAEQTARGAHQTSRATDELSRLSSELQALVGQFKI
jgi:methyl-accepting chemotaxis protein